MARAFWVVVVSAVLTGLLLVGALLFLRSEAVHTGLERTEALMEVIGEQTARTLQAVEDRLQLAATRLELAERPGPLAPAAGSELLRAHLHDLPFVRAIWVLDAAGTVVLDSDGVDLGRSLAGHESFLRLRQGTGSDFVAGPLVRNRDRPGWLITASRALRDADGTLRGAIVAAVEPPYFEQLWRAIDVGENGSVALYQRNGQLILRSPADHSQVGRDYSQLPLFKEYLPGAPQGVFVRRSPFDKVERMAAYRELPTYPQLVVVVATSYQEVLAPWRRFTQLTAGVWAAALLIAAVLTWKLRRHDASREATEQRFRQLAQAVPQIVFITDAHGAVQFVNQRWQEVTGRPLEEALGSRWQELVHAEDRAATVERLGQMVASGQPLDHELRLRQQDGAHRWQLLRAVPFHEHGHQWWYGTATDIDDLKQAQARLHAQAELMKIAGRLARLGAWTVDIATQRVRWSEEAAVLLDMPSDAEPTLPEVIAMVAPGSLPLTLRALQDCFEHGQPFDIELELVTQTGRHVWLRSIGQPLFDSAGRVAGIQGAQQDITARMRMADEIRGLNARLEEQAAEQASALVRQLAAAHATSDAGQSRP